jgi:hypothetical protein
MQGLVGIAMPGGIQARRDIVVQARLEVVNRNLAKTFQQQDHLDVNIHKGAAYRELMERRKQVRGMRRSSVVHVAGLKLA